MTKSTIWHWILDDLWNPASETWDRFQRDDGSLMAAAVSYYAGVSLMPLLIVLGLRLGRFSEDDHLRPGRPANRCSRRCEAEGSPELQAANRIRVEPGPARCLAGRSLGDRWAWCSGRWPFSRNLNGLSTSSGTSRRAEDMGISAIAAVSVAGAVPGVRHALFAGFVDYWPFFWPA